MRAAPAFQYLERRGRFTDRWFSIHCLTSVTPVPSPRRLRATLVNRLASSTSARTVRQLRVVAAVPSLRSNQALFSLVRP